MRGDRITYSNLRLYKYELEKSYQLMTDLQGFHGHANQHGEAMVFISPDGMLTIKVGYKWDGPSGIARDTLTFMRGSLVHDALYHLLREKVLPKTKRRYADALMRRICMQDGMNPARAITVFTAVRLGGKRSADHDKPITVRMAPRLRKRISPHAPLIGRKRARRKT